MSKTNSINKKYSKMVDEVSPKNKVISNCFKAFLVGGTICTIGNFITNILIGYGLGIDAAAGFTSVILIFLGAALTAVNVYEKIGKFGGAGSAIPITGFANSMVSTAMEHKTEGYIFGLGANIFKVAGPVIVYGIISSSFIGLIYYFLK